MPPDRFWSDPPWRGGRPPFRLGLQPVAESVWLPDPICNDEYRRKSMLLAEARQAVLADLPEQIETVRAGAEWVRDALLARGYPERDHAERHPLARAALLVPDDLCILAPGLEGYVLIGACLCSPSYWRLADKIGKPLVGIHAPVEGLEQAIGPAIARFMDNLPPGRVFERRNWNIHRDAERFHPVPDVWDPRPGPADCAALYVRSERQTLRRLDGGGILFTIGVGVYPLAAIRAYPAARMDLLAAIAAMSPAERRSFGYHHHGDALVAYLEGVEF